MIVTFGNIKGGVGKTTIAINTSLTLAREGHDVLFIDADRQGSGTDFFNKREEVRNGLEITAITMEGKGIVREIPKLATKYDHVIIDTAGSETGSLRAGIGVSDLLAVPTTPQALETWAMEETNRVLEESVVYNPALKVRVFINMVAPRGGIYEQQARKAIPEYMPNCRMLDGRIVRRQAFANSLAAGLYIMEHNDPKAQQEFMNFYRELIANMEE